MSKSTKEQIEFRELVYWLTDEISDLIVREHQALDNELNQISTIIKDAAETIEAGFNDVNNQSARQSELLQSASENSTGIENQQITKYQEEVKNITNEITGEINKNVVAIVRSLQFEDIVQQLVGHSRRRVKKMEILLSRTKKNLAKLNAENSDDSRLILAALDEIREDIICVQEELEQDNPVKQESMEEGNVDIF